MDREAWIKEAMRLAWELAGEYAKQLSRGAEYEPDVLDADLEAHLRTMMEGEPVAYMWQHEETGRFGFLAAGSDIDAWRKFNPRLKIVCPLYTHPTIPEGMALVPLEPVDAAIIKTVLPQAYALIDELVAALGDNTAKGLRTRAGRLLPAGYVHSFTKKG